MREKVERKFGQYGKETVIWRGGILFVLMKEAEEEEEGIRVEEGEVGAGGGEFGGGDGLWTDFGQNKPDGQDFSAAVSV